VPDIAGKPLNYSQLIDLTVTNSTFMIRLC
jgi:hypothetical protein